MRRYFGSIFALLLALPSCSSPFPASPPQRQAEVKETPQRAKVPRVDCTAVVASLIDPAKLDTLKGERAANGRLRRVCHWLAYSRNQGDEVVAVIDSAQALAGYRGTARAREDKKALLRNLTILERLGCLDAANMAKLRRGRAPTITRGPYAGTLAEVDRILPRALFPQLDEKLFNLEFMPAAMNRKKGAKMGQRQRALERQWRIAGLL